VGSIPITRSTVLFSLSGYGMNKLLKYGLLSVGGLLGLFAIFLGVIAFTVDPNSFKPQIVNLVQEKTQRTLTLEGDIKLKLFPRLGLDLGKTRLSEHQGVKDFASLDSVQLYVAWLPLLQKELVIRKVSVVGARANLVRNADGTTNFDDLISKDKSAKIKFDIDGVKVSRGVLSFDDRMTKRKWAISDLELSSGRIKDNTHTHVALDFKLAGDNPQLVTRIVLKSGLLFVQEEQHYALDTLDLKASGVAAGISQLDLIARGDVDVQVKTQEITLKDCKISLTGNRATDKLDITLDAPKLMLTQKKVEGAKMTLLAKVERQDGKLAATFTVPDLSGSAQQFQVSQLSVDVDGKQGDNHIKGKLMGPLTGSLDAQLFSLPTLSGNLDVANPKLSKGGMKLNLAGNARADLGMQELAVHLNAKLDDSTIQTKLSMNQFANPSINFDIAIDQLDVDRYLPPSTKATQSAPESPIDFSALKAFNASGSVRIGQLKVANLKSSNVRLDMKADSSRIEANRLSGASARK
jgi:AsmA protein